ncbi:endonuclease domain-containing 1 protein-like isoform X4 [Tachysurus fulvidraco]|uniref:endonuclease domain-containing 1 protein-like isoform X4 n=1 Tax=Tachysurus fulvidraco TaxID=1234273 RepID=UPI001FEF5D08|nr:endonuclease domain-containing 1 protein-like isoform X4 [Tachysurus fulvidraco]XP_047669359.1 endonuclease domain-containing 1 protein-like isoform X4 [Tachysurus fulvidraco]
MKILALVLLLSSFSSLTLMEVVKSFKDVCSDFFIHKENDIIIPTIFPGDQYKNICQRWKNKYRFATVYDTVRRIPVYSAYTFSGKEQKSRSNEWKIEPQLEDITEMNVSPIEAGKIYNQAVDSDYANIKFTRGHLFPYQFTANQDQADSTFTLTNAAPQALDSNQKWAKQVETPIRKEIKQGCQVDQNHLVYIVTGVVPGKNWIPITRDGKEYNEGVNIPSHFWSAYCCTSNKGQLVARAFIAEQENFKVKHSKIQDLNTELTDLYKSAFSVFPGLDLK